VRQMTSGGSAKQSSSEDIVRRTLRASEYRFLELVEGIRDYAIILLDADGNIASWNQGAERLKGYKAHEIIGTHFSVLYPTEATENGWPQHELRTAKKEGRFEDEGWRVRKDGSRFWANVIITALRDDDGSIGAFLKITRDLTARKQAEEQRARLIQEQAARKEAEIAQSHALFLAEASQSLASSFDEQEIYQTVCRAAVPFLADICIVDRLEPDGSILMAAVNEFNTLPSRVLALLSNHYPMKIDDGYLVCEVIRTGKLRIYGDLSGLSPQRVEPYPPDVDCVLLAGLSVRSAVIGPLVNQGSTFGAITFAITRANRRHDPAEVTLADDLARRLSIAVDHALLHASAQEAKRKAEATSRAKDRFLAMLSHELRTPLLPILFSSSILSEDPTVPETTREHLRVIQKNAELETRLIDDLLDVTRISKGKLQLNLTVADAHEVLRTALETCSPDIESKQLLVSANLRAKNYELRADIDRLQQVFWNLLKNAIKFTPSGGRIVVRSVNLPDKSFRVEIQDSGKGISSQLLSKIFDPFEQGEDSFGLGLGLTISKTIVELHGGRIIASSLGLGKGSTFVVELPVTAGER
jgi:PAS domain S-box-containing protein